MWTDLSVKESQLLDLFPVEPFSKHFIPRSIHFVSALNCPDLQDIARITTKEFFHDSLMLAESDSKELQPLKWEKCSTRGFSRWEDLRYHRETGGGRCPAHDMYYAFVFLPWSPMLNIGSSVQKNFHHLWSRTYKSESIPSIPPLHTLKKLKGSDVLTNGMWIILVRMPRPQHGKPHVPLSQRKDYKKNASETEEMWLMRKAELKKKAETDLHPTEAQLYLTLNHTLIQEVAKNIVCAKCGAKGHHHEKSHDDVYSSAPLTSWEHHVINTEPLDLTLEWSQWKSESNILEIEYHPSYPEWMNVKPYPKEQIVLTKLLEEDKGLTLQIRQAETKIPLRLARKLMMDGLDIQGDVYASGVGTRKQVRREAEEEEEKRKKTKLEPITLHIDLSDEDRLWQECQKQFYIDFIGGRYNEQFGVNYSAQFYM